MPKRIVLGVVCLVGVSLVAGCASTRAAAPKEEGGKLELRAYSEDRPRVDQELSGNRGYLMGTPKPEETTDRRPTRRVYVVELTKSVPVPQEVENFKIEPLPKSEPVNLPPARPVEEPAWRQPVQIPSFDVSDTADVGDAASGLGREDEVYVVQEGDTLQKISKKYYDTYKKWTDIFEANKEVLRDNPNWIKPGMRLTIPMN